MLQVRLLPAIGLIRQGRQRPVIALPLEEANQIIKTLGQVSLVHCQLHQAPAVQVVQVVVLAIAVTQVLHDLLLQGRDDKFYKLC